MCPDEFGKIHAARRPTIRIAEIAPDEQVVRDALFDRIAEQGYDSRLAAKHRTGAMRGMSVDELVRPEAGCDNLLSESER
ncbi:MAG TPA: hypothetical protein VKG22_10065 [Stellaceae bacterium]|nr:hypothetical protein [Stellaceae bacterium]HMD66976.1 hypothetical protein [Stellaceae bacterium]